MARLTGKAAFVTGAAGGIGRGITLALAREGATVAVVDIDEAEARKTAVSLLGDDEKMEDVKYKVNEVIDMDPQWVADADRRAIGDAVLKWPAAERKAS